MRADRVPFAEGNDAPRKIQTKGLVDVAATRAGAIKPTSSINKIALPSVRAALANMSVPFAFIATPNR